jgi:hypothetical protein
MKVRPLTNTAAYLSLAAVMALNGSSLPIHAQESRSATRHQHETSTSDRATAAIAIVREATARFRDVSAATAEGYGLMFGCVSGPDWGAMGLHYVNGTLFGDSDLDPMHPEIVIYEPLPNGRLRLIGADYLVLADAWHAKHGPAPPELMGQLLHLFESPNRFGLPAFYTLHVWAWKDNPNGAFVNWHPKVSCEAFDDAN